MHRAGIQASGSHLDRDLRKVIESSGSGWAASPGREKPTLPGTGLSGSSRLPGDRVLLALGNSRKPHAGRDLRNREAGSCAIDAGERIRRPAVMVVPGQGLRSFIPRSLHRDSTRAPSQWNLRIRPSCFASVLL
jgi:hypothetical protein